MLAQRIPTRSLEDRTIDVMKAIEVLQRLPKYPEDVRSLMFFCRLVAMFCQTVEVNHTHSDDPNNPEWLGWVNPLDWLVDQVGQTCFSFPPPIKWRRVYCDKFEPLDGKDPAALELAMED